MISLCTGFMWFFFPLIHWDISRMNYGIYLIDNQFSIKIGQMYGSKTLLNGVFFFFKEKTIFCILLSRSHVHARLIIWYYKSYWC